MPLALREVRRETDNWKINNTREGRGKKGRENDWTVETQETRKAEEFQGGPAWGGIFDD